MKICQSCALLLPSRGYHEKQNFIARAFQSCFVTLLSFKRFHHEREDLNETESDIAETIRIDEIGSSPIRAYGVLGGCDYDDVRKLLAAGVTETHDCDSLVEASSVGPYAPAVFMLQSKVT